VVGAIGLILLVTLTLIGARLAFGWERRPVPRA
jgi:hypothetical protein